MENRENEETGEWRIIGAESEKNEQNEVLCFESL